MQIMKTECCLCLFASYLKKIISMPKRKPYNLYFQCYSWCVVKELCGYKTSSKGLEIKGNRFPIERKHLKQTKCFRTVIRFCLLRVTK